jgi:hypothetical protein
VGAAHILDGRVPHSLLLEVFTNAGIGTMVVASAKGLTKATGPATRTAACATATATKPTCAAKIP